MDKGPKGLAISIISKMKKPSMESSEDFVDRGESEEEAYDDGFSMAADEVMLAMKRGDKRMFREALRSAIDMCGQETE